MTEYPNPVEKKKGGCGKAFGIGCLVLVLFLAGGGLFAYLNFSKIVSKVTSNYTADAPSQLPQVAATEQEVSDLTARVGAFSKAVKEGHGGRELRLTSHDINVLIQKHPAWTALSGTVYVTLEGEHIQGDASIPLDQMGKMFKGRWLNGSGAFRVEMAAGRLLVFMDSLSVRGKQVPESFMAGLRTKNLAEQAANKPETAALLEKLESLSVRDGKLTIKAK
jgi:hypothetical protein